MKYIEYTYVCILYTRLMKIDEINVHIYLMFFIIIEIYILVILTGQVSL